MAKYTAELNEIVNSGTNIFPFNYQFYDSTKKAEFQQNFIDHFYFREIGVETVGRFIHNLKCKFIEVLPYYDMLFKTALINYEKTINYNLSDTYTRAVNKTDSLTGNVSAQGTKNDTVANNNTLNRNLDATATGNKTNSLDSVTDHTEDNTFNKNDNLTESGTNTVTTVVTTDHRNVESTTPSGLLSMDDIKNNLYASTAKIDDNTTNTNDGQSSTGVKINETTETTDRTTKDTIDATQTDVTENTNNETVWETNKGDQTANGTFDNTTNTAQNATGNEQETSTRIMKGSYGVITEADMLQKHIALQHTLTTILTKFFDECEDLFMQVY